MCIFENTIFKVIVHRTERIQSEKIGEPCVFCPEYGYHTYDPVYLQKQAIFRPV